MKQESNKLVWIFQIIAGIILLMTLPAKFSGAAAPVALFTELGMEPAGRYITAIVELIAGLLILIPASAVFGAFLGAGVMSGALIGHITKIGFAGDYGKMAIMATVCIACCLTVLYLRRRQLPIVNKMFGGGEDN